MKKLFQTITHGLQKMRGQKILFLTALALSCLVAPLFADGHEAVNAETLTALQNEIAASNFRTNNLWILISAFLVFIMHLGFACLESGLTRGKNTINILFKNVSIIAIGLITYAVLGFNLMYPGDAWGINGFLGFAGFGIAAPEGDSGLIAYADGAYSYYADFIFQAMFAATAATIVSGAVAERIKINSFLIFSLAFVGLIYPVAGSWKWGGGWLEELGFYDFAGSTLVHALGGWGALAGAMLLGPRKGKYGVGKRVYPILGDNIPLAAIGMFLLWFGWYGFNGGSVLSADPNGVSLVFVTTSLAAAGGIAGSLFTSRVAQKNYDLSMVLNGALAGLVSITAGADVISPLLATLVGVLGGIIVVLAVVFIDNKLRIDDPVGAISVHLVCGIWGTLAVGLFSSNPDHTLLAQFIGVVAYALIGFIGSAILFTAVKAIMGLRVTAEEEQIGLDLAEHKMEAYHGFQLFTND